jgi:hypothetical protein
VGGPVIDGVTWDAYRCGWGLGGGDYDVIKRYGTVAAQRSYMCRLLHVGKCTDIYDGQDRR